MPVGIYIWALYTEPVNQVSWIAFPLLILTIGGITALVYAKQRVDKSLRIIGFTYMLASLLIFAWLFPIIDSQSPMQKHKKLISSADNLVAYDKFNDAFVFYSKYNIPTIHNVDSLTAYINSHNNAVILCKAREFKTLDSLPNIRQYSKDRDLFSLSYSAIYIKK
jgi:hypothetical protein